MTNSNFSIIVSIMCWDGRRVLSCHDMLLNDDQSLEAKSQVERITEDTPTLLIESACVVLHRMNLIKICWIDVDG